MTHRHKIGDCCKCDAALCCQTNGADYEGPAYWEGGDYDCLHVIKGCVFDKEIMPHKFPKLNPQKITMEAVSYAAGFQKGVI
jgi:hypothetical protein